MRTTRPRPRPPAAYLRYYPQNPSAANRDRIALRSFAARLGLPTPVLYLDNGCPATGLRPELERLITAVMKGNHRLLVVPGLWVFSPEDDQARLTVRMLSAAGCLRIFELPDRARRPVVPGPASLRIPCQKRPGL
ncbi:hypothetical protein FBY35_1253 [Streptomyces sp. SLBN-118]|uniref:recombinase family protein n=1 Tax=Streptomyces sp. SLBN-118 TaxID=2768454 RepID=UPI0011674F4A|nr:recombinase family protein [Streptomyces sp. SLBN-118]TQK50890.1 hypothetical protein FBY35_1253 [Streptomyces sp. SLBN-118]